MKRPKLKKASKRMTCHKRYKIQKKVREHHRKLRKEAKKRGHKKPRKDPGVPNSAPFKEALLREAELRKQQLEELKQQQKLDRQKEQERKRKLEVSPGDEQSNVETREESDEPKRKKAKAGKQNPKKLHCQELKKVIEASDIVLEVLDARDPLGCRCPQIEEAVIQSGSKKLILVLNKSDKKEESCSIPKQNLLWQGSPLEASWRFSAVLWKGYSSWSDWSMQIVPLDKQITIIDSPCLIISPCNSPTALALRSPASIEELRPLEAASAILSQADNEQVVLKYTVPEYKDSLHFFTKLAQRRGLHQKGGSPNVESAAKLVWSEWTGASLGYYCHPPASWNHSLHFNENIAAVMKKGFNLEELEKNNAHSIQVLKGPHLTNRILFRSSGLTNGILDEKDIVEESPRQTEDKQDADDQENGSGERNAEISDVAPVEETRELSPEQSTAGKPSDGSSALDRASQEDETYDFTTDYI